MILCLKEKLTHYLMIALPMVLNDTEDERSNDVGRLLGITPVDYTGNIYHNIIYIIQTLNLYVIKYC